MMDAALDKGGVWAKALCLAPGGVNYPTAIYPFYSFDPFIILSIYPFYPFNLSILSM